MAGRRGPSLRGWAAAAAVALVAGTTPASPAQAGDTAGTPGPAESRAVAPPVVDRSDGVATLLRDGTVLVSGGTPEPDAAEVFDPSHRGWSLTGPMVEARSGHTATLLGDGRVLVTGGVAAAGAASASTEIYDPRTRNWSKAASMAVPRSFHTATRLKDGRVLVAGGQAGGHGPFQRDAEVFDPRTSKWGPAGALEQGRSFHAATLLADGRVLVSGGQGDPHGLSLRDASIYDPAANTWAVASSLMAVGRAEHTMTLLGDGTVLVVGGSAQRQGDNDGDQTQVSAELWDPGDGSFRAAPAMATSRRSHVALLLPSGRVLAVGGLTGSGGVAPAKAVEVFDAATPRWEGAGAIAATGDGSGRGTATLLEGPNCGDACGQVLVVGSRAQLYSPPRADVAALLGAAGAGGGVSESLYLIALAALAVLAAAVVVFRRRKAGGARRAAPARSGSLEQQSSTFRRNVAFLTDAAVDPAPTGRRRAQREAHGKARADAGADAGEVLAALERVVAPLRSSLERLVALRRPRLLGKVEEELSRLDAAARKLAEARAAAAAGALGDAGALVAEARRLLSALGRFLSVALAAELAQAATSRPKQGELAENADRLRATQETASGAEKAGPRSGLLALPPVLLAMAEGWALAADVLGAQAAPRRRSRKGPGGEAEILVVGPGELETFDDVGGLDDAKAHLRRTVGMILERGTEAAAAGAVHNGVLLHGPPGTGKTLLARAVAGEYGLRYLRFSPALVASAFQHEPAKKLRQVFARAADAAPCLLFLDEVDVIGGRRDSAASPDQRELATQLLTSLEEHRGVPGLVIMAATNDLDHLDPALREGRFDSRVAVALPDAAARAEILRVLLGRRGEAVEVDGVDLDEVAARTAGRSGAALAGLVAGAAERAMTAGGLLGRAELLAEVEARSGTDRAQTFEDHVAWGDVVLPEAARKRLGEILLVFARPELGRSVGVRAPAGILLHGPPGTGKTTVARALAGHVRSSFYELSAADVLSKWAGESEQKVAQLFTRARANRPSIIFIDEIDALLRRRSADSATPWEERIVSQFLRELDGLVSSEGVLLVGSTNRPDIIDEAVRERRLVPIEVPLPDEAGRRALLDGLFRGVRQEEDVDLDAVAAATGGMSGADLKAVRDAAGMKALARAAVSGGDPAVASTDVAEALAERGVTLAAPVDGTAAATRRRRPPAGPSGAKPPTSRRGARR